jgi:hypothetical protein
MFRKKTCSRYTKFYFARNCNNGSFLPFPLVFWINLPNPVTHLTRVVKTMMMRTFGVEHHNNVYLNTFGVSIKTSIGKSMVTLKLPPLPLAIKNGFQLPILWWPKIFNHQTYGNQIFSIAIFSVCHFGHAIYMKEYLKEKRRIMEITIYHHAKI